MPLHRSLTLWFGLLGLLFLLGAWADSTRYHTGFQLRRLQGQDGALELTYRYGPGNYTRSSMERQAFPKSQPRWFERYHWQYATGFFVHFILPHWLLILPYTATWIALLLWRHRRIKRSATAPSLPGAARSLIDD